MVGLTKPKLDGTTLILEVKVLEGGLTDAHCPAAVFIDWFAARYGGGFAHAGGYGGVWHGGGYGAYYHATPLRRLASRQAFPKKSSDASSTIPPRRSPDSAM